MTTATNRTTNGEYYDHQRQTWMVRCGSRAYAIDKRDANGQPVPPPDLEEPEQEKVSSS